MSLLDYICQKYGLCEVEANGLIMAGRVLVNEQVCIWVKYKVKKNDVIRIKYRKSEFVTRSGLKLEKALRVFKIDVCGKNAIDIGASQGGFTDCLLKYGIGRVYAVDVAYGLLDCKLRGNSKVKVLERTNAKYLTDESIPECVDLIVSDVSFISLYKVIIPNIRFLKEEGEVVMLFKPQFELPASDLGKNGMPLHKDSVIDKIEELVIELQKVGLYVCGISHSPIKGNSGNEEYLLHGKREKEQVLERAEIVNCVLDEERIEEADEK